MIYDNSDIGESPCMAEISQQQNQKINGKFKEGGAQTLWS